MNTYETGPFIKGFPARFYVPQEPLRRRSDDPPVENPHVVLFDVPGKEREGIRLGDVLKRLDRPKEVAIPSSACPSGHIHLTIKWPGVRPHGGWRRKISVTSLYGRTRESLAVEVFSQYTSFFAESDNVTESRKNSPPQWHIGGKTGIQAKDLILVALYQASATTWMAQLAVDRSNLLPPVLGFRN